MTQKPEKMDSCQGVEREVNKVQEKFHALGEINHHSLEEALQLVRVAKAELQEGKEHSQKSDAQSNCRSTSKPFVSLSSYSA